MRGPHLRSTIQSVVAILCAACFLSASLGSVSRAIAAETWETWPNKTIPTGVEPNPEAGANRAAGGWDIWPNKMILPGVEPNPAADANRAAEAGEAAGKKTTKGTSSGTIWWIAAGTAVLAGIAIAIAAGGGGGGSDGSTNPGHH